MKKTWLRWLPAALVPVLVVGAALAVPAAAGAAPQLPAKSAQQVLELIASSSGATYSGTVEQSSKLGLPQLPASAGHGPTSTAASVLELLTASHTARVYVGANSASRVQLLDSLAERNVIRNGSDLWLYDSRSKEVTRVALPNSDAKPTTPGAADTPADIAQALLSNLDSSTTVTVGNTATVAGRSAYTITLAPKTADTLIDSVVVAADSATGLPLRVTVNARGQADPAVTAGFTTIDFNTPDPSVFAFTPPAGVTVKEQPLPADTPATGSSAPAGANPTVTGTGWSSVVEIPAAALAAGSPGTADPSTAALLDQVSTPVAGGRVVQTALLTAFLTTDGRLFLGAVPVETLQAAAAK